MSMTGCNCFTSRAKHPTISDPSSSREPQQHSFPTPAATRTPAAPCNALPLWPFRRQPSPPTPHATLSHALPSLNTLPAATRARLQSLQTILSCSENSVLRMVRLYPRILDMAPQDVQMRLLDLKVHHTPYTFCAHIWQTLHACVHVLMHATQPQLLAILICNHPSGTSARQ